MSFTHRTLKNGREVHIGLGTVGCLLEEFLSLFPDYKLSEPYVDLEYVPGMKCIARDAEGNVTSVAVPWDDGDKYLAHADDVAVILDCRRHRENWEKEIAGLPPARQNEARLKLQMKLAQAKDAEARIQGG